LGIFFYLQRGGFATEGELGFLIKHTNRKCLKFNGKVCVFMSYDTMDYTCSNGGLGGTLGSPFFLKSFHLLDSIGGGDVPLGLHSTELVDSNPPPKNSIRKSTNSVLEQTEKVGSTTARGRTLPRN